MRKYLEESWHWLYLALFKPRTLAAESRYWTRRQKVTLYFRVIPVGLAASMILVALAGSLAGLAGYTFDWTEAFATILVFGFLGGQVVGLGFVLLGWLVFGLVAGQAIGLGMGLVGGLGFGLFYGLLVGIVVVLVVRLGIELGVGLGEALGAGLGFGLVAGLAGWLVGAERMTAVDSLHSISAYTLSFLLVFLRPFYLIPYAVQYRRGKQARDPFKMFRNSPVYWDEGIATPLPRLTDWLVRLVHHDRSQGLKEILFVAEQRPYQRRAAQRALIAIAIEDLQRIESLEGMARAAQLLEFLPAEAEHLPAGLSEAQRRIEAIAALAQDFLRVRPEPASRRSWPTYAPKSSASAMRWRSSSRRSGPASSRSPRAGSRSLSRPSCSPGSAVLSLPYPIPSSSAIPSSPETKMSSRAVRTSSSPSKRTSSTRPSGPRSSSTGAGGSARARRCSICLSF